MGLVSSTTSSGFPKPRYGAPKMIPLLCETALCCIVSCHFVLLVKSEKRSGKTRTAESDAVDATAAATRQNAPSPLAIHYHPD